MTPRTSDTIAPRRRLELEQVFNFRDLGGYRTVDGPQLRWGRVFRADGLHRLTESDLEAVRRLGLRTVIDLRTPAELAERGTFPVDAHPVDFHHLPIIDVVWDPDDLPVPASDLDHLFVLDRYLEMIEEGESRLASALQVLASPGALPAVFHCAAGKDRTGILAALVLALCGVPDESIIDDYALSHEAMTRMTEWYRANVADFATTSAKFPAAMITALPETMRSLLAVLRDRHGSIENYVASIGVNHDAVASLRAALVDTAAS